MVTIVEEGEPPEPDRALDALRRLRAAPRRRLAAAATSLAVGVFIVALAALGQLGVGPFARGAPATWMYVATARTMNDPAREVVAEDVATGEHRTFAVGAPIFDLALSADRRQLFLASDEGRVFILDAFTGTVTSVMHTSEQANVEYVVPLDRSRLLGVVDYSPDASRISRPGASLVVLAIGADGDRQRLDLGARLVGRPLVRGQALLAWKPSPPGGFDASLMTVSLDPLSIEGMVPLGGHQGTVVASFLATPELPPVVVAGTRGPAVEFDPATFWVARLDDGGPTTLDLTDVYGQGRARYYLEIDFTGDAAVTADGRALHICFGAGAASDPRPQRFVVPLDTLVPVPAGKECGVFAVAADGTLALATADRLYVLDPRTGRVIRSFSLGGYATRARGV